ncbi:MAG: MMPL family transporter, partial [Methanomicrobiales archaeon]|nr:MMPL family transporter [Methanomicrobiales archaeon]
PVIPIIFIVGWNGAIMYLLNLDYTPLTAVLGSMTIGVASEYTILIMERCEEELARGMEFLDAIQTAVQKIGIAVTVSGLTTVFGFSALILSTFNIVSNFGIVTVISVGFSLMGAIIVMPAVLALMHRHTGERQISGAASS